jgi:arylsulfatase A-like enzyme
VVDGLKTNHLYDNTLIFYTSDNGAQGGQGGTSFPLRGFKTMLYEGGVRVPCFVSGGSALLPTSARGTINYKLLHVTDWLPTIVNLVGGSAVKNKALDGHDVWKVRSSTTACDRSLFLL